MADAKKEYKDMLKILEGMATPPISSTKLTDLSITAENDVIKKHAANIAAWLRARGGTGTTKFRILDAAQSHVRDASSRDHQFGKNVVALRDYCQKEIDSVAPDWQAKALAAGWVPDWEATATAAGWTQPTAPAAKA